MKKALAVVAGFLAAVATYAQGTIDFRNRGGGIDAPVYLDTVGGAKLDGSAWMAQLYAAAPGGALAAVGAAVPFRSGAGAGYWDPAPDSTRTVPGVAVGSPADVVVRVWASELGTTFEAAQGKGMGGTGESAKLSIKTGGDLVVPALLTGLAPFTAASVVVPEPSVLALGALGAGLLALRRKK
jgi:hypothetical protein